MYINNVVSVNQPSYMYICICRSFLSQWRIKLTLDQRVLLFGIIKSQTALLHTNYSNFWVLLDSLRRKYVRLIYIRICKTDENTLVIQTDVIVWSNILILKTHESDISKKNHSIYSLAKVIIGGVNFFSAFNFNRNSVDLVGIVW